MERFAIFGYGSLLNPDSVRGSIPDVLDFRPCYIKGFTRDFSILDPIGFNETNFDVAGIPFCALDVKLADDPAARVNGVLIQVSESACRKLLKREEIYQVIEAPAYDYVTSELLGSCAVFSAAKNDGSFNFDSPAQLRYLEVCLQGARLYGEAFYTEFLKTTTIDGAPLGEIASLKHIL